MKIKRLNIKELWKRKAQIIEGYYNRYLNFRNENKIKVISEYRMKICRTNTCGLYDKHGWSKNAYIKGAESCGGCGCVLKEKTSCLSCFCYLQEIGEPPLWKSEN